MSIQSTDIDFLLSTKVAGTGYTQAQSNVNESLGKYISTTEITDNTLNNLFDNISGDENAASDVEYRCFFVLNNHSSLTLQSAVCWISSEVAGGAVCAIGLDPYGVTTRNSVAVQAVEIANEGAAPTGVSFSAPTGKASGLSIGDIPASSCAAIWVRRTAQNTVAVNNDGVTIRVEGDTAA